MAGKVVCCGTEVEMGPFESPPVKLEETSWGTPLLGICTPLVGRAPVSIVEQRQESRFLFLQTL